MHDEHVRALGIILLVSASSTYFLDVDEICNSWKGALGLLVPSLVLQFTGVCISKLPNVSETRQIAIKQYTGGFYAN